jgi:endonuclease G
MMKSRWGGWIAIALIVLIVTGCNWVMQRRPNVILPIANVNLTLGNPSNAKADPNNYLLEKPQYVISYNNSRHILNWSSWQLDRNWLGDVPRSNNFRPDEGLPQGFYPVRSSDYNGSGFDRGHMTPSGDRSRTAEDNSATFLMTNILPQAPDNNQGPWRVLEDYCRELVMQGKELYIIAGGYGNQRSIGKSNIKITAPDRVWKVIVVSDKPGLGVAGVNPNTRLIAVDMPNQQGIREDDWRKFRVSVDLLEERTGYNFLTNVSDVIQVQIEKKVDRG